MDGATGPGIVVWQRVVDDAGSSKRWRRLIRWYSVPAVAAILAALVFGGVGPFLAVAVAVGALAGVLALVVFAYDFDRRGHTEIRLVDGCLVLGGDEVRVDAVEAWTTHRLTGTSDAAAGAPVVAVFRVRGTDGGSAPGLTRFAWAEMPERDLDDLRASLAAHIEAPWVPFDRISD
jgi:hypothetical protein